MVVRSEQLACFLAICQSGSINKAGAILHTSPQNVSKMLKQLEDEIGTVLVLRSPRGILLTPDGQEVLQWADATMQGWEALKKKHQIAKQSVSKVHGELSLICSSMYNLYFLDGFLAMFQHKYPHIVVSFDNTEGQNVLKRLQEKPAASAAVMPILYAERPLQSAPAELAPYEVQTVHYDRLVALVSKQSPLSKYDRLYVQDLLGETFILGTDSANDGSCIMAFLKKTADVSQLSYVTRNPFNVFSTIQSGLGVGVVQLSLFLHNALINQNAFHTIEFLEESRVLTFLVCRRDTPHCAALRHFLKFAQTFFQNAW